MKTLAEIIVKSLVDDPDKVEVSETKGSAIVILEIKVISTDVGKVIGKSGRIANAIRTIVKAVAAKNDQRVVIEVMKL